MKNDFLILLLGFLAACGKPIEEKNIRLTGRIENHNNKPVEFVFYRDYTNNHREIITLELDVDNCFEVEFNMPEPAVGTLRSDRFSVQLFLRPGDQLELNADASDWPASLRCSGKAGPVNQFFVDYQREIITPLTNYFYSNAVARSEPAAFKITLDSIVDLKTAFLANHPVGKDLDPAFKNFFETEVRFDHHIKLLEYPVYRLRLNHLAEKPELAPDYYDFLLQDDLFDDSRLNSETYVNFLMAFLEYCALEPSISIKDGASENETSFLLAHEYIPGLSGEYVQAISINREFNYGDLDKAQDLYRDFMTAAVSNDLKQRVTTTWDAIQALTPGHTAPDFSLTDINGKQISLSDFRGKVVYLKFWASWCGPCMRQVPPAKELKKKFAEQEDLVFMYVSIDTDTVAWHNTVEKNEIRGLHFNTPGRERGVPALYQVKWIPAFFIIGKDGNIFDNRPPRPSDSGVDEALLRALSQ